MQADIKRHRSDDGSSVWIDPAYMRHNFISEQERSALEDAARPGDDKAPATSDQNRIRSSKSRRQTDPLTPPLPTPPTMPDALTASAHVAQSAYSTQSPVPLRASRQVASQSHHTPNVRPKYPYTSIEEDTDITRTPTIPQSTQSQQHSPMWQYESPDYEIESSISSLSLVVSDLPTRPESPSIGQGGKRRRQTLPLQTPDMPTRPDAGQSQALPVSVCGIPTRPDFIRQQATAEAIDTVPPPLVLSATNVGAQFMPSLPSLAPSEPPGQPPAAEVEPFNDALTVPGQALIVPAPRALHPSLSPGQSPANNVRQEGLISWTAGGAGESPFARRIACGQGEQVADPSRRHSRNPRQYQTQVVALNPLDHIRWWLLHPGRIEFILWLAGTVLLISVTCVFLLTTAFSFGWLTTGPLGHLVSSSESNTIQGQKALPTVVTSPGLKLVLLDQQPLLAGQPIHLHGVGFTAQGRIIFTYDTWQLFSNTDGMTNTVKADAHGAFTVTLVSGTGWSPGLHLIEARDLATGHVVAVKCILSQGPIGKGSTATPGPLAPGSTPTPSQGTPGTGPGSIPTPVGQTPVPITPTATVITTPTPSASPSPSPTQTPVTPTPTTPPPTPTPGITPTAGGPAPSPTPGTSTGASSTIAGIGAPLITPTSPPPLRSLFWLIIPGYALAMLLLGLAGLLHQRRQ